VQRLQRLDASPQPDRETGRTTAPPKGAICEETYRACSDVWGKTLEAVVLTGSVARDEASFLEEHGRWKLLGDAEFVLVFERAHRPPHRARVAETARQVETRLEKRGITASIGLSAANRTYLRTLKPHLYGYELRHSGQVVWGNPHILSLIPQFSSHHIPLEDAWRLLGNRIVEQVQVAGQIADAWSPLPLPVCYRTIKLYLDMATSLLLFLGDYAPTYRERCDHLKSLAENSGGLDQFPFAIAEFSKLVEACTEWKLSPRASTPCNDRSAWIEAVNYARLLWRWELDCLARAPSHTSGRDALFHWMQLQPLYKRLRGWAYVLRACGWHRSWRHWPHWIRLGWRASPRYWVYASASELFFKLDDLLALPQEPRSDGVDIHELRSWLPLLEQTRKSGVGNRKDASSFSQDVWQRLAGEIAWNYHEFLEGTRA
jgi:hypothetical protein